jgi:hypothetical protein
MNVVKITPMSRADDCDSLWADSSLDEASDLDSPPTTIPNDLLSRFTYDGKVAVREFWMGILNGNFE